MPDPSKKLAPPAHVRVPEDALPFWNSITAERAAWSNHELELAAMLARTMAMLQAEQRTLNGGSSLTQGSRGHAVLNPRVRVVKGFMLQVIGLRRTLGLTPPTSQQELRKGT